MVTQGKHRTSAVLGAVVVLAVAVLSGTSYAASRPSHHPAVASHHALSKSQIKSLIASYVTDHVPQPVEFAATTDSSTGGGPVKTIGPWTIKLNCNAGNVTVEVDGPGIAAGANTLGAVNGTAGASFETFGGAGGSNGAGSGFQTSQTLVLLNGSDGYTVTYMANIDKSTPANCDLLGYAIPLTQ